MQKASSKINGSSDEYKVGPPTGSVVATARPIDTAIWERNRSEITDLYFVQNKPLNEVMEYMSSTHNFHPR